MSLNFLKKNARFQDRISAHRPTQIQVIDKWCVHYHRCRYYHTLRPFCAPTTPRQADQEVPAASNQREGCQRNGHFRKLCDLHWLPVCERCWFKLILTHRALHGTAPVYLRELTGCSQRASPGRPFGHCTYHGYSRLKSDQFHL